MSDERRRPGRLLRLVALGMVAGLLSGVFGVGGGLLVVPGLIWLIGLDARRAAGTSLLAVLPTALVGVLAYAGRGQVDAQLALLLGAGGLLGAPAGSRLLHRLPLRLVRLAFLGLLAATIVSLLVVVPSRQAVLHIDPPAGLALLALGFLAGVCSGLLGIGGGAIVVPALTLLFGTGDLLAKGSSLLMMVVTSLSGTLSNALRRNVDVVAALVVGLAACATTGAGAWLAAALPPRGAGVAFAAFLLLIGLRLLRETLRDGGGES